MVSNRDLEQYEQFQDKDSNALRSFFKKTSPEALIGMIGLFFVGYYFISKTNINPYVVLGAMVLLVGLSIFRMNKAKEEVAIPLETIRILAVAVVERSVGFVYERGTNVQPGQFARLVQEGNYNDPSRPKVWLIGVLIIRPNNLSREVRVMMHPYTGFCIGITPSASGFTGLEPADRDTRIIIPTNEFTIKERTTARQ